MYLQAPGIKPTIWEECCKAKGPSGTLWAEADGVRVLIKTTAGCSPGLLSAFRSEQLLSCPRNGIFSPEEDAVSNVLPLAGRRALSALCSPRYHKPQPGKALRVSYSSTELNHLLEHPWCPALPAPSSQGTQLVVVALLPRGTGTLCPESKA